MTRRQSDPCMPRSENCLLPTTFCHESSNHGPATETGMIERAHPMLSIGAQCRLLSISRSSFYREPAGETENLDVMRLIDKQFLETPFLRRPTDDLACAKRGLSGEPEAYPAVDAAHAFDADLPRARHQQTEEWAQDLSVSAGRHARGSLRPGLVLRYHLTCRCGAASSISSPSWTGSPARCWPGASRRHLRPNSVSKP